MQETATVPVRTITVDWTLPLLAVGFILLALVVLGLMAVLMASRRRRDDAR